MQHKNEFDTSDKLSYTTNEAAYYLGYSVQSVRYYTGLLRSHLNLSKSTNGHYWIYSKEDLDRLDKILYYKRMNKISKEFLLDLINSGMDAYLKEYTTPNNSRNSNSGDDAYGETAATYVEKTICPDNREDIEYIKESLEILQKEMYDLINNEHKKSKWFRK